jgi:hypothetical protein
LEIPVAEMENQTPLTKGWLKLPVDEDSSQGIPAGESSGEKNP